VSGADTFRQRDKSRPGDTSLLFLLFASASCAEDPLGLAVDICLVLDGDAAEVREDVLHVGISVAAGVTAKVVDPLDAQEQEVDNGNNDGDTDRVTPDNDNGDDRGLDAVVV